MSMQALWMTHRSMTADQSVKNQKLKPGTLKRIFQFAVPYKKSLSLYLATVVIDALLVVAAPLLLRELIDNKREQIFRKLRQHVFIPPP